MTMKPGDVLIQRGTMHAWYNTSDSWARMHFILMGELLRELPCQSLTSTAGAEPAVVNGQTLGPGGYSRDSVTSGGPANGHSAS